MVKQDVMQFSDGDALRHRSNFFPTLQNQPYQHGRFFLLKFQSNHITSCKFFVYFARKNILFLFYTSTFTKHLISLSILHIYSIKYSFFLHFLLFPSLWNKLTNSSSPSSHTHTHPSTKSPTPRHQPPSMIKQNKPVGITGVH